MQDVTTNHEGLGDEATSPQTKKRIVARIQVRSSVITSSISASQS